MTTIAPSPVTVDLGGTDVEVALRAFELGYNGSGLTSEQAGNRFLWRHTAVGDTNVTLRTCRFDADIRGEIAPDDAYVVAWFPRGGGIVDKGRADVALADHRPFVFPAGRPFRFQYEAFDQRLVQFDAGFLERIAAERTGGPPKRLRFDHAAHVGNDRMRVWSDAVRILNRAFAPAGKTSALAQQEAARLAATVLLTVLPPTRGRAAGAVVAELSPKIRPAIDYINAHPDRALTLDEIATSAGVSTRVLQKSFRENLDTTVTGYIRSVRLERARAELRAADPAGETTVADVADRWGFLHAGRFSAYYAQEFGEHPRQTLAAR